jgi:4-hydroxy-tetrahydrodipicolinate synthase
MQDSLRASLTGTGVAIITPFAADFSIDYVALEKIINYQINNGANYIVTLGTTGETPTITIDEQKGIIDFTYKIVNNRVPIVVGISGNSTANVVEAVQSYNLSKAIAVLSASPYYSKPSQEGIFQHYKAIAAASPKPVLLYNVPGRTGRNMEASTTIRLANEVENIAGIKEATDNINQCMYILKNRPEHFAVVSGDDALTLGQIALGMDGVISVAANSVTKPFCEMVQLALKGNFEAARNIHYKLLEAYDLMFVENNPAGIKAFMYEQGLIQNILRLPVVAANSALQAKIKAFIASNEL